jgi:hypothetical protein
VRRRAVVRLLVSAFFGAVWISALYWLMESGHEVLGPGLALPLLPFVYYLLELVSGRPVPELAKQWDALAGWQRGVLGTLVVITIFTIMITVVVFFVSA